jgi:hypothetical protein
MVRGADIDLTDDGDGAATLTVEGESRHVDPAPWLPAARVFDREQLLDNLALTHQIGNYGEIDSQEYLDAVNKASGGLAGIEGKDKAYRIAGVKLLDPVTGDVEIGLGAKLPSGKVGPVEETVSANRDDLTNRSSSFEAIQRNLVAFFRLGGFTSLTPAALAALKARNFWM